MTNQLDAQKAALRKIVAIFNTGDLAEVDALFAAEYVDHQRPAWLEAAGPEEFKQIALSARAWLPNLRVTLAALIAEGDSVAARLHWRSASPTGEIIERETLDMLRFARGQVVEHWGAEAWVTQTIPSGDATQHEHNTY